MKYYVTSILICLLSAVGADFLIVTFSLKQDIGLVVLGLALGILVGTVTKNIQPL